MPLYCVRCGHPADIHKQSDSDHMSTDPYVCTHSVGGVICSCKGFQKMRDGTSEAVNHPKHYGGKDNAYEAIKVIEAWQLDFCLGNSIKYIARAGKKDPSREVEDLEKALFYLNRRIEQLKKAKGE